MSVPFGGLFTGRSVFVTGHTGFKGSWLSIWLSRLGAKVTGYALEPPTEPNNFTASDVADLLTAHHLADIRDAGQFYSALEEAQPDIIFHLAAQSLVRRSYTQPKETFDVNVTGTCSLLDGVRALKRSCVVIVVTSDKCYENRGQQAAYRETDPIGGHDPYSASKGAAELAAASYRRSFFDPARLGEHGVKLATARAGNAIGGGDWAADRIVTDIVTAIASGEEVLIRNPGAVRPWQHVVEPLGGYLTLAAALLRNDNAALCTGFNFGPHPASAMSVRELVELFLESWGKGTWRQVESDTQLHEASILRLSIDKAVSMLGWRPRWDVGDAVERTVRWYRKFYQGDTPMLKECVEQIEEWERAAQVQG